MREWKRPPEALTMPTVQAARAPSSKERRPAVLGAHQPLARRRRAAERPVRRDIAAPTPRRREPLRQVVQRLRPGVERHRLFVLFARACCRWSDPRDPAVDPARPPAATRRSHVGELAGPITASPAPSPAGGRSRTAVAVPKAPQAVRKAVVAAPKAPRAARKAVVALPSAAGRSPSGARAPRRRRRSPGRARGPQTPPAARQPALAVSGAAGRSSSRRRRGITIITIIATRPARRSRGRRVGRCERHPGR